MFSDPRYVTGDTLITVAWPLNFDKGVFGIGRWVWCRHINCNLSDSSAGILTSHIRALLGPKQCRQMRCLLFNWEEGHRHLGQTYIEARGERRQTLLASLVGPTPGV